MNRTTLFALLLVLATSLAGCHRDAVITAGRTRVSAAELASYEARRAGAANRGAALEVLKTRALLAEAARRDGLDDDPAVRAQLDASRREILAQAYLTRVLAGADREDLLYKRHEAEKKALTRRVVHVAQIAFHFPQGDARAREVSQARAARAYARLSGGEPFEKVARELSEDVATRDRGGDLGPVVEGQVDPAFFQAAAALKPGESSAPLETPFGFHLLKALEPVREEVPSFEHARSRLAAEARHEAEDAALQRLRKEIAVTVHAERATKSAAEGPTR